MTWSPQRDDNALAAIDSKDARIDCKRCVVPFGQSTVEFPGPGSYRESATTLERGQHGTLG
jgi:hypothetical protein